MGSVPLIAARRVGSIDELVAAAAGGARVRVAGLDEPVAVRLVRLVQLWVEAADHNVEVVLARDVIEFRGSSGRCWAQGRLGLRSVRRFQQGSGAGPCYLCDRPLDGSEPVNVDHWYPRSKGGPEEPWNLRAVHRRCNERKGDAVLADAAAAYVAWIHGASPP